MDKRILLVEDDLNLGFVTKDNLEARGYHVTHSSDGQDGLQSFNKQTFDICLLDVMLPKLDGFALAEIIRTKDSRIPIIFLTAKSMQEDKLEGFKRGGDDYVTKPFSMEELVYRIESCLKRRGTESDESTIKMIGNIRFDPSSFSLTCDSGVQKLTRRESEILNYLCRRIGVLVKREDILLTLWGENDYFKGRSLDVFISKIRKYLKVDPMVDIENYHGVGFKLMVK